LSTVLLTNYIKLPSFADVSFLCWIHIQQTFLSAVRLVSC